MIIMELYIGADEHYPILLLPEHLENLGLEIPNKAEFYIGWGYRGPQSVGPIRVKRFIGTPQQLKEYARNLYNITNIEQDRENAEDMNEFIDEWTTSNKAFRTPWPPQPPWPDSVMVANSPKEYYQRVKEQTGEGTEEYIDKMLKEKARQREEKFKKEKLRPYELEDVPSAEELKDWFGKTQRFIVHLQKQGFTKEAKMLKNVVRRKYE